ncbi:hypothetical protein [Longimicrobium sp.]|uniref:hypothetical protein n=1 Tax=Longimicrobium sp. TaxID=2029185 RepID=UPI002E3161CE|nr:hypothetical protein [Longimicrobium sp.]HEX6039750.1 hypothetical protein [Longimicrobium sp.]
MDYPLQLSFKLLALAPQIYVRDRAGQLRMYVKQKLLKLKEQVTVFADEAQSVPLYHINADRVIDFNARYNITSPDGRALGSVRRRGRRSLWRANYEIMRGEEVMFVLKETNPWAKVGDALFGEIPVLGMFAGYVFHPHYSVSRADGTEVLHVAKQSALFEGKYEIEKRQELSPEDEGLSVLGILMMLLLERRRG